MRGIGKWGGELAVVVIGVLIALGLAQWVEDRAQREADARTENAVRRELLGNIVTLSNWRSLGPCHEEQIRHIRDLLLASDGDWPGIGRRALFEEADERRTIPGFLTLWAQGTPTPVWDAAVASGAVDRWDAETRIGYREANALFLEYDEMVDQMVDARARLGALVFPGRLSDSDRLEALNQLILLDSAREYMMRPRDFMRPALSDEEIDSIERSLAGTEAGIRGLGSVRPCYSGPVIADIFADEVRPRR